MITLSQQRALTAPPRRISPSYNSFKYDADVARAKTRAKLFDGDTEPIEWLHDHFRPGMSETETVDMLQSTKQQRKRSRKHDRPGEFVLPSGQPAFNLLYLRLAGEALPPIMAVASEPSPEEDAQDPTQVPLGQAMASVHSDAVAASMPAVPLSAVEAQGPGARVAAQRASALPTAAFSDTAGAAQASTSSPARQAFSVAERPPSQSMSGLSNGTATTGAAAAAAAAAARSISLHSTLDPAGVAAVHSAMTGTSAAAAAAAATPTGGPASISRPPRIPAAQPNAPAVPPAPRLPRPATAYSKPYIAPSAPANSATPMDDYAGELPPYMDLGNAVATMSAAAPVTNADTSLHATATMLNYYYANWLITKGLVMDMDWTRHAISNMSKTLHAQHAAMSVLLHQSLAMSTQMRSLMTWSITALHMLADGKDERLGEAFQAVQAQVDAAQSKIQASMPASNAAQANTPAAAATARESAHPGASARGRPAAGVESQPASAATVFEQAWEALHPASFAPAAAALIGAQVQSMQAVGSTGADPLTTSEDDSDAGPAGGRSRPPITDEEAHAMQAALQQLMAATPCDASAPQFTIEELAAMQLPGTGHGVRGSQPPKSVAELAARALRHPERADNGNRPRRRGSKTLGYFAHLA